MSSPYVKPVPLDKVIEDLHRFPKTQPILILGPPGIGKSEGVREFAIQEVIRKQKDIEVRFKKRMPVLLLDNPHGTFKELDEEGKVKNQFSGKLTECIVFIDTTQTGPIIEKPLNDYARDLIGKNNLVYVFINIRLSEVEPRDLLGLPATLQASDPNIEYSNYAVNIFLDTISIDESSSAQDDFTREIRKVYGLLFLDDFTNVDRKDVLSIISKMVSDRMIGYKKISPEVRIIAAGTHVEKSGSARKLPSQLLNRFAVIKTLEPSAESWYKYMIDQIFVRYPSDAEKQNVLRKVIKYLAIFFMGGGEQDFLGPNYPHETIPLETSEPFPTPRSWTNAVFSIDLNKCKEFNEECFEFFPTFVGKTAYDKFITWLNDLRALFSKKGMLPFSEEMLDYSKDQLNEYLLYLEETEKYNWRRFVTFLNAYALVIKDKNIWDHGHDLRKFFNNLIEVVKEHRSEDEYYEEDYKGYMRLIALALKMTIQTAGVDGREKPLFKSVAYDLSNDVNNILFKLTNISDEEEVEEEVQNLREKFENDPVYCIKLQLDFNFFEGPAPSSDVAKVARQLVENACKDIVPLLKNPET